MVCKLCVSRNPLDLPLQPPLCSPSNRQLLATLLAVTALHTDLPMRQP